MHRNLYRKLAQKSPERIIADKKRDVLNTIHESYGYISPTPSIIQQLHRDLYTYNPTVLKALNYLLTQKLICKKEIQYTRLNQKRHYCEYWTTFSRLDTEEQKKKLSTTK